MSLKAKLDASRRISRRESHLTQRRTLRRSTMHRATAELIASRAAQRAKKAGDVAPVVVAEGSEGNDVSSDDLVRRASSSASIAGSGVHTGTWNFSRSKRRSRPSTGTRLAHRDLPRPRRTAGNPYATTAFISDPSDVKGKVSAAFGFLSFELPDYLVELYSARKNNLLLFNDDPNGPLPMPHVM